MHVSMILSNHVILALLFFPVMLRAMFIRCTAIMNEGWVKLERGPLVSCIRLSIPGHILMPCVTRRKISIFMVGERLMLVSRRPAVLRSWGEKRLPPLLHEVSCWTLPLTGGWLAGE